MVRWSRFTGTLLLAVCLTGLTSCQSSIRVDHVGRNQALFATLKENMFRTHEPSVRTIQTLRKYDLDLLADRAPAETEQRLLQLLRNEPVPDLLYALAELTFHRGLKSEHWHCEASLPLFYRAAGYSYHYLFMTAKPPTPGEDGPDSWFTPQDVFDPRFRLACELYNQSLGKCLKAATQIGRLEPSHVLHVPTPDGGTFRLSIEQHGFVWKPGDFQDIQLCSDYRVRGLTNHHRTYGLGVPLIVTRVSLEDHNETYLSEQPSFAATAFFRFEGNLDDMLQGRCGKLELYDPLRVQGIEVRGLRIPLESDITTPLAYSLARSELKGIGLKAFLRPQQVEEQTGIYMIEPYQPGKIPVLFVHGLLSSPLTWAQMFNDLRAEPDLRDRYQFWFYFYPTSAPYLVSASDLRQRLELLRRRVDPSGQDPNFNRMVLVGHSMGGLVSKLQTVDSGDEFYKLTGETPLDSLDLSKPTRTMLQKTFYFQANPSISRVIFLGTPHRGSGLSLSSAGRLAAYLAGTPHMLMETSRELLRAEMLLDPSYSTRKRMPSSVDLLKPSSPALEVLLTRPRYQGTKYHSIVGVTTNRDLLLERIAGGQLRVVGDGVVPYSSAHLADVDSELIVPANHMNVQEHPLSVLEVRRILREHLKTAESPP